MFKEMKMKNKMIDKEKEMKCFSPKIKLATDAVSMLLAHKSRAW